jgi:SAM-dependent methyltransferase
MSGMRERLVHRLRPYVRSMRYGIRAARYLFGKFPRECSVCGYHGRFFAYGNPLGFGLNLDALCPKCLSLERHRLLVLCDKDRNLFANKEILHFAPEDGISTYIRSRGPRRYITCEYGSSNADLDINIEAINLPSGEVDLIVCCHVLEHVSDSKALPELFRILRAGGVLVAMTPVIEGWARTFEDETKLSTIDNRLLYFNQHDHVRFFGSDVRDRLKSVGFAVDEYTATEPDVSKYGLIRGEKVFVCEKPI